MSAQQGQREGTDRERERERERERKRKRERERERERERARQREPDRESQSVPKHHLNQNLPPPIHTRMQRSQQKSEASVPLVLSRSHNMYQSHNNQERWGKRLQERKSVHYHHRKEIIWSTFLASKKNPFQASGRYKNPI